MADYEYRVMSFARGTKRSDIRRALTDEAEYGRWELHRTRIYLGGATKTWLRRRIIRAQPLTRVPVRFGPG